MKKIYKHPASGYQSSKISFFTLCSMGNKGRLFSSCSRLVVVDVILQGLSCIHWHWLIRRHPRLHSTWSLCMLGYGAYILSSADFFQYNFFNIIFLKLLSGSGSQTVLIQTSPKKQQATK